MDERTLRRIDISLKLNDWLKENTPNNAEAVSICINMIATRLANDAKNPEHLVKGIGLLSKVLEIRAKMSYDLVLKQREEKPNAESKEDNVQGDDGVAPKSDGT